MGQTNKPILNSSIGPLPIYRFVFVFCFCFFCLFVFSVSFLTVY